MWVMSLRARPLIAVTLAVPAFILAQGQRAPSPENSRSGFAYGGGPEQLRYSSLTQINRANVKQLQVAWTYDTRESGDLQTQPVVADGTVYAYTPSQKVFALDGATGKEVWTFDAKLQGRGPNRGVMIWQGDGGDGRRVFAPVHEYIYALDGRTGEPLATFGDGGRIDLRENLGREPKEQSVRLTTPGAIYRDLLIVGGRVNEGLPGSPGHIRAYDVRTGQLRWTFRTIPHPGEFGYETWSKNSWTYNAGANGWSGMALDERRGIVFIPTGSAAADFYGANRLGDNLFANSLIALDAATGRRIWHFQIVRHDILDRDLPSPPNLVTLRQNGRAIDAAVQATKHGFLYVFDRASGKPVFPIEYRKFPASDVPGEVAADTQPIPSKPKPFARQLLTRDMLTTRTPEARKWAEEEFSKYRSDGPFAPLTLGQQTFVFPGYDGGAEWGGSAVDPTTGLIYINANDIAWSGSLAPDDAGQSGRGLYLRDCATCHRDDLAGTPPQIPSLVGIADRKSRQELTAVIQKGGGRMPAFPNLQPFAVEAIVRYITTGEDSPTPAPAINETYIKYRFTGYRKFLDPDGYPAVAPPWGTLNAINLNTGEYAWQIPFGEYPELVAKGLKNTGSENYGGPIVTAGGLVFIGATNHDRKFRAFDKATGELLWETLLPFSGNATPATYEAGGRQYVVIAASGGKSREPKGGIYVAFALPEKR
jgi:quinoprotein glucose dehydrogenase